MYSSISNLRFLEAGVSVEQTTEPGSALAAPAVRFVLGESHFQNTSPYLLSLFGCSVLAALAVEYFPV